MTNTPRRISSGDAPSTIGRDCVAQPRAFAVAATSQSFSKLASNFRHRHDWVLPSIHRCFSMRRCQSLRGWLPALVALVLAWGLLTASRGVSAQCVQVSNPITSINGANPASSPVFPASTTSLSITLSKALNSTSVGVVNNATGLVVAAGSTASTSITLSGFTPGSYYAYSTPPGGLHICQVTYQSPNFTIDSTPSVSLSAPTSAKAPAQIPLSASVSSTFPVTVTYLVNNAAVGSSSTAPYSFTWSGSTLGNATGVGAGSYSIQAKATDSHGATGTSGATTLTVSPPAPPTVNLSVQTPSRTMLPATVSMSGSASDAYTIASLKFIVNGTTPCTIAASSGSCTAQLPVAGGNVGTTTTYTIQAQASDYWGGVGLSNTVSLTETGHPPPTVTLNSAEATWLNSGDPEIIAVAANASDVDAVASVAVLLNGSQVQTLTQPPYNFQVGGYGAGTYSVAVQATNTVGQATLSAAQNVTVAAAPAVNGDPKNQTRTTKFEYDANTGNMTKKLTEPEDSNLCLVQTFEYDDSFGNINKYMTRNCNGSDSNEAVAPTGSAVFPQRTTTLTYDPTGTYPQKITNALNQTTTINEESKFGTVVAEFDPNNLEIKQGTNSPDSFGRITQVIAPDSTQSNTQYLYCSGVYGGTTTCPSNAVTAIQITSSNGGTQVVPTTTTFYDVLGRVVEVQTQGFDGTIIVQDTIYDNLGRVHQVSQPYFAGASPVYTTNSYDTLGRARTSTDANSDQTTYTYDGLETSATDANGHTSTRTLNGQHLMIAVIDAMDQVMSYQYDPFGNLIETIDATGVLKSYVYDIRGRKTQMSDPDMGTWSYVYDSLSELVQQTDAKSQISSMTYDLLGRITSHTEPDLTSNWEYDNARAECTTGTSAAVGHLDRAWTTAGSTYSRIECYDTFERPLQERTQVGAKTYVAGVSYDPASRIATQTYPAGYVYPGGFTSKFNYNSFGYLSKIINNSNSTVIWQANTLDSMGDITSDSMAAGAFTDTRSYDVLGRLHTVQAGSGNTIQNDTFDYDAVGNLHDRSWIDSSAVSHTETFGYDPLDRLTSVTGPANKTLSYDAAGNLTYKSDIGTYSYTSGTHRVASITGTVNGVSNPSFSYDNNGNVKAEAGLSASWTSFNMPSLLTRGSSSSSFTYGPEHERITQVATSSGGTVTTNYAGSSFEQVITSSTGVTENHYYISAYGRRIAMLVDASNATSSWRYFHQDHLSTVEVVTDQNGTLVERLSYDAWGKRRNLDGTDSATPIGAINRRGYTDQEELDSIGLVHMNARIYDPVITRFLSADSIIQFDDDPQSHNRYSYALNRPLHYIDPTGHYDDESGGGGPASGLYGTMVPNVSVSTQAGQDVGQGVTDPSTGCLGCSWNIVYGSIPGGGSNSSTSPDAGGAPLNQPVANGPGNPSGNSVAPEGSTNIYTDLAPAAPPAAADQAPQGQATASDTKSTTEQIIINGQKDRPQQTSDQLPGQENIPQIIVVGYNGKFHDELVRHWVDKLNSTPGFKAVSNLALCLIGSTCAVADIVFVNPDGKLYVLEFKTGNNPDFTPEQYAVYPHLSEGGLVEAPGSRITQLGYFPYTPLPPIDGGEMYQQDSTSRLVLIPFVLYGW
jgi:RHS repeat-associated protein